MDISLNEPTLYIAQARLTNSDQPDGTYSAGARSAARFQDYKEGNNYIVYYDTSAVRFCEYTFKIKMRCLRIYWTSRALLHPDVMNKANNN